jgi:hypothetical protein
MKYSRLLVMLALLGVVAMSSAVAKADGVPPDPHFIVNQCTQGANGCDVLAITPDPTVTGQGDITESFAEFQNVLQNYVNDGTTPFTSLVVTIDGTIAGSDWQCFSDIFEECSVAQEDPGGTATEVITFDDDDPSGGPIASGPNAGEFVCENNGAAQGICPGFIAPGEVVSTLIAPEPSSMLLLTVGLVPVLGLGRKRRKGSARAI